MEIEGTSRLGVQDKRQLFQSLLAMTERLLMLNKFPVDQKDFALSMHPIEVEQAWRCLTERDMDATLSPAAYATWTFEGEDYQLHVYPDNAEVPRIFINSGTLKLHPDNRFYPAVSHWAKSQKALEIRVLHCATIIKEIVLACNTVGQYKRVSPELLPFLPEQYAVALKGYTKASPMPPLDYSKEEIDKALSTLAMASLQPPHHCEKRFQTSGWRAPTYSLECFPRTARYANRHMRELGL